MGRPPEPNIVSLIVGNGNVKGRWGNFETSFPSVVGTLQSNIGQFDMLDIGDSKTIGWGGASFVYGHNVKRYSRTGTTSMSANRADGVTYTRLFIAGLCELLPKTDQEPDVVITTVPMSWYSDAGEMQRFKNIMTGQHRIVSAGREFTYNIRPDAIKVLPEGLPTLINHIYNDNLKVVNEELMRKTVGVVQWGSFTTDLMMFDAQQPSPAYSFSVSRGLSEVWRTVREKAGSQLNRDISLHEADEAVKRGYIEVGKHEEDIRQWSEPAIEQLVESVIEDVNSLWDNGGRVKFMLSSGGGAPQTADYFIERFRNNEHIINPDIKASAFDEANGLYKFAKIKMRQLS